MEGTAAARAGLQPGDVVTRVAGREILSAQDFHNVEGQVPVGEALTLDYQRGSKPNHAILQVESPVQLPGNLVNRRFDGAVFTELPARQRSSRVSGVLLAELEPGSRLAYEGLRPGDIITGVNRESISSLADMKKLLTNVSGPFVLQIHRNGESYFARIE
jgi:S1-C subfamily serine protease